MRTLTVFFLFLVLIPFGPVLAQDAQEQIVREADATVLQVLSQETLEGDMRHYELMVLSEYGVEYQVDTQDSYELGVGYHIEEGDEVKLAIIQDGEVIHPYLVDVHRVNGLSIAFAIFAVIAVAVGLLRGLLALFGLMLTTLILFLGVFPLIQAGYDPVLVTVGAAALILLVNMHVSHGLNRRTFFAFLGTLGGLGFVYVITQIFLGLARLSGVASDEGALLFWELDPVQAPVGILAAGIILGAVGVLDDVAMTQAELVEEIASSNPNLSKREVFTRAMRIGRHHVASTVNTLVLVYAGAALPVFLLFLQQSTDMTEFLNNELVAEELIRILAGTCALILTVPLSTWLCVWHHRDVDKEKTAH